ncbi:hypothetical protein HOY82DRAFT_575160 [Tuber indicum]|nr:hypothetical protein HOY82DRAFT_575160 [Tuber indicum]
MSTADECMPPADRSAWRDTHIYSFDNRETILGGLWVSEGITNANLYSMLEIFCFCTDTFVLHDELEQLLARDSEQLRPGNYYIVTNGSIRITDRVALTRTPSFASGPRVASFLDAVRERDRGCVITGRPARLAHLGKWGCFEAAHIFPLGYEQYWNENGYGRLISIPPKCDSDGSINSVQNGLTLAGDMHHYFASYDIAINPDDNYKIVSFTPELSDYGVAGHHLSQTFIDNPLRPLDELLRWHFQQAVLVNMKGAGEPCFETEFPPGSDIMCEIMRGSNASERMQFELFSRFNAMGDYA